VTLGAAMATLTQGAIQTSYFNQTVDHFDHLNQDTYLQRYFHDDQFFNEQEGPVFLYVCGEGTCYPSEGYFGEMAQEHEAM
jgi:lysosomal Pro-X carboxypeptidase